MNNFLIEINRIKQQNVKNKLEMFKYDLNRNIDRQNEITKQKNRLKEIFREINYDKTSEAMTVKFEIINFLEVLGNEIIELYKEANNLREIINKYTYNSVEENIKLYNDINFLSFKKPSDFIGNVLASVIAESDIVPDTPNKIINSIVPEFTKEDVININNTAAKELNDISSIDSNNNVLKPVIICDEIDLIKLEWKKEKEREELLKKEKIERELAAQRRKEEYELLKQQESEKAEDSTPEKKSYKKNKFLFF